MERYFAGKPRCNVRCRIRVEFQGELPLQTTEFREIILLREFEELSYQEIAALLNCPAGTVMSRLARARSKLRVILSSALTGPMPSQGQGAK